jgi:alginate O-acetyltransferase complex protein AlgI
LLFHSPFFLTVFLPIALTLYCLAPEKARNGTLLLASFLFYFWGEPTAWWILLLSTIVNYLLGLALEGALREKQKKAWILLGVLWNLGILGYFKYAGFFLTNLNTILRTLELEPIPVARIPLLLGISFFSFHAISYLVDVYRGDVRPQKSFSSFALYMFLFPQLIAGPSVRYKSIEAQFGARIMTLESFGYGVIRFSIGLAKKVLFADKFGLYVDRVFHTPYSELSMSFAWLGLLCYGLQIYFDFSGYSDMAVGLGRLFGFTLPENFYYPYCSRSITEFWRRWHMSLSAWFKDYVYIPLGGNRKGPWRTYRNLWAVFLLCGLWHGASWTFLVWGFWHGLFLVLERLGLARVLEALPVWLRWIYVWLVVGVGWVWFRADNLREAQRFLWVLVGLGKREESFAFFLHSVSLPLCLLLFLGVLGCGPAVARSVKKLELWLTREWKGELLFGLARLCGVGILLFASATEIVGGTFHPFIYFRF